MRHFHRLATGIKVGPLLADLARQPMLWNAHDIRTATPGSPHSEVDDILVRFNSLAGRRDAESIIDDHESVWFPAFYQLPEVRPLIFDLMAAVKGERLGRVIITRLKPGGRIAPHADGGSHAEYYERYQVCLHNSPGSLFRVNDEVVTFAPGETWWLDNSLEHEVLNNSKDDRLVVIIDIRKESYSRREQL